uniref:Uncharacterized protein n=1 Tax=Ciona intestinalis TaxID=7719 RepID=H2XSP1_CIOIN
MKSSSLILLCCMCIILSSFVVEVSEAAQLRRRWWLWSNPPTKAPAKATLGKTADDEFLAYFEDK